MHICALGAEPHASFYEAGSILALSSVQAGRGGTAHLHGVVTVVGQGGLFLQDATGGIWIFAYKPDLVRQGDDVVVDGVTDSGSYSPVVVARVIRKLGRKPLPVPRKIGFTEISNGEADSQFVSVTGTIRSAGLRQAQPSTVFRAWIKLEMPGGFLFVSLPGASLKGSDALIGAYVRINGVASCTKNENRQITSATLIAPGLEAIALIKLPPADLFAIPLTPIGRLMQYRSGTSIAERARVHGVVTYYTPGSGLVIQENERALSIQSMQTESLQLGDRVEAVGFPTLQSSGPVLEDAVFRKLGRPTPVKPLKLNNEKLSSGAYNHTLVSIEGRLVRQVSAPSEMLLFVQDGAGIVTAELERAVSSKALPSLREGSKIRVSGICALEVRGTWNLGPASDYSVSYKLLLRSPDDVIMLDPPSWWTPHHLVYVTALLSGLLLSVLGLFIYGRIKHWRLQAVMTERERFSHEMHDTLAQGFTGLGFQLQAIRNQVPANMPELQAQVDLASKQVRHSHKEARRSMDPMLPPVIEGGNLMAALEATARSLTQSGDVAVNVRSIGIPCRLPASTEVSLLRIGQEAIANAIRHANPGRIDVTLSYGPAALTLTIADDGSGFVKSGNLLGFGLSGMRRRAASMQGEIEINSQPGSGTSVCVKAPVPRRRGVLPWFKHLTEGTGRRSRKHAE